MTSRERLLAVLVLACALAGIAASAKPPPDPWTVTDYDQGDFYLVRGDTKMSYHGMRAGWVYNRAMVWFDQKTGLDGAILCYSSQSPLPLTGKKQVSRWHAGPGNEVNDVDDEFLRFVKKDATAETDHVCLPPFQFQIEQHPVADLEVKQSTHPWQFVAVVKGRSGPPLYASPWQTKPGKLTVNLLEVYRRKGYDHHFAEMVFFVAVWTKDRAEPASVLFRLSLAGGEAVVPSLPIIRTAKRAETQGMPLCAVVLDRQAKRLGKDAVEVTASLGKEPLKLSRNDAVAAAPHPDPLPTGVGRGRGSSPREQANSPVRNSATATGFPLPSLARGEGQGEGRSPWIATESLRLSDNGDRVWKTVVRGLPPGDYQARFRAVWKSDRAKTVASTLLVRVTDGKFTGYDSKLRLLTRDGKPLGPLTGSYRGQSVFRGVGTPQERLLHGQDDWKAAIADPRKPDYGFHFWESLTECELDADYAYLARCGWDMVHLCSAWLWWPRFDAGGRLSPQLAEQLAKVCAVADRHGLKAHLAVSHYPLGMQSLPYAQYLEAGYQPADYQNPNSKFFAMFTSYLKQLAAVFREETAISSFTPAGEGDPSCGKAFVNMVADALTTHDGNHLVLAEPHHQVTRNPNYYRLEGWKPLVGGMRTYHSEWLRPQPPESIGVEFKLAAMGHIFMGEGCFYGFLGGNHQYMNVEMPMDSYRQKIRETIYTGLAHRNPILLTWEERIVEDERAVFDRVCRRVDWSTPFRTPPLAMRVGPKLMPVAGRGPLFRHEAALAKLPLECCYVWEDETPPKGVLFTLDARKPFVEPAFVSQGGQIPDALKAEMPLRLPVGFAANYSWSEDRRTLLAFLHDTRQRDSARPTTEAGHFTYADTTRVIERDMLVDVWEVECVRRGAIELHIYRKEGNELVRVGRSETVEMTKPGPNRFALAKPIVVKAGDIIGFYIRSENAHIAADHGGNMLNIAGAVTEARTPLNRWQTERKMALISVFNAGEVPTPKARPVPFPTAAGVVLQNFPADRLAFQLFDLATKRLVASGEFRAKTTLKVPREEDHFFLLVTPSPTKEDKR